MKTPPLQLILLALVFAGFKTFAASTPDDARSWPHLLEREWLLEARMRAESQHAVTPATRDDAAGGCDGVRNGKWGFHTGQDANPWWQVDLGQPNPLAQVRLWNRSDNEGSAQRASKFLILLSHDGKAWREVYQHNGQTLSCTGCHDSRKDTPPPSAPLLASLREPSKITVGPEGSWTMRFDQLIQPVLDAQCVRCHHSKSEDVAAAKFDLTPAHAYKSLTHSGKPSLNDLVLSAYREGVSTEGHNPAVRSAVMRQLAEPAGHHGVKLDRSSLDRFVTWMDTYAQRAGTFSPEQEQEMERLRSAWADLLIEPAVRQASARAARP